MIKTYDHHKQRRLQYTQRLIFTLGLASVLVFQSALPVCAKQPPADKPVEYTEPDFVSPFSKVFQGIFGLNALAGWIGSRQVEREIRKKVDGDLEVELLPYSAVDLKNGKARKLTVFGQNLLYDKAVYITEFHLVTDDNTPIWIDLDSGKLKSPLNANVVFRINEPDMNRTFTTPSVSDAMSHIKVPILGVDSQTLRLISPKITLRPTRLRLQTGLGIVGMPDERSIPLDIETGMEPAPPENTRIGLTHLKIAPISGISSTKVVEGLLSKILGKFLNPSKFIPMDNGTFYVEQLVISEEAMTVSGHVRILPETPPQ